MEQATQPKSVSQSAALPYAFMLLFALAVGIVVSWYFSSQQAKPVEKHRATVQLLAENPVNADFYASLFPDDVETRVADQLITASFEDADITVAVETLRQVTKNVTDTVAEIQSKEANRKLIIYREQQRIITDLGFDRQPPSWEAVQPQAFGGLFIHREAVSAPVDRKVMPWWLNGVAAMLVTVALLFVGWRMWLKRGEIDG